jgi:hypothetical protein
MYDLSMEVTLATLMQLNANQRRSFDLKDTPIVVPVIFQSTFSQVDPDSLNGRLWLGQHEDPSLNARSRLEDGFPFNVQLAVLPITSFVGQDLRWQFGYRTIVYSSAIDEEAAIRVTWPREWPDDVKDGLKPQMYVESDAPFFADAVRNVSGGQLRMVPPYLAAKDLVRYCVTNITVSGSANDFSGPGILRGMRLKGALETAQSGVGTAHDLTCLCIAMLRAAGIPARPVVGVEQQTRMRNGRPIESERFVSWGEFYLPNAGWIPFDPDSLRTKSLQTMNVRQAWTDFGTLRKLNERIPMSYHFIPPSQVQSPQAPAVWGWDPRPNGAPSADQYVTLRMQHRGRVPEDPGE